MYLRNASAPQVFVAVWMKQVVHTPIDIEKNLQVAARQKAQQRTHEGVQQFTFRPDTIVRDGHQHPQTPSPASPISFRGHSTWSSTAHGFLPGRHTYCFAYAARR
jgi:hypothetical protein